MTNDCICSNVPRIWRLAGVTRTVRLTVTKDGSPYDFTGLQTVLRIDRDNSDFHYEPQFTVEGDDNNIIVFAWAADKQPLGDYTIEVTVTDGSGNKDRVNWHGATGVRLVEYSNLVKGEDAAGVESDSELGLDGIFTMNGVGMDAYEEWLADGNEGSLHDYILWMQGPAREAAEVAEAQMAVIQSRADDDHTTAGSDHTRAAADHTTAESDHTRADEDHQFAFENRVLAYEDHLRAEDDHTTAAADHTTAQADHATAGSDHTRAEADHATAASDHSTAASDHTKAGQDSTRAGSDHDIAVADHAQSEADHTRAEGDHTTAAADHTTSAADHTTAASDHTTAAADHTQAVADHAVMAGYDTRLTNVETDVTQLGQEVDDIGEQKLVDVTKKATVEQGKVISQQGEASPTNNWEYLELTVRQGDKYVVSAVAGLSLRLWIIVDAGGNVLALSSDSSAVSYKTETITIPENGVKLYVNARQASIADTLPTIVKNTYTVSADIVLVGSNNITEYVNQKTDYTKNQLVDKKEEATIEVGKSVSTTGAINSVNNWEYLELAVNPGEKYTVSAVAGLNFRLWIVVNSAGVVLALSSDSSAVAYKTETVTIPNTASKIYLNARQASFQDLPPEIYLIRDVVDAKFVYVGDKPIKKYVDDALIGDKANIFHYDSGIDKMSYILSPFNTTYRLKNQFYVKRSSSASNNPNFNFDYIHLVTSDLQQIPTHAIADDITPAKYNGTYLGGNHGDSDTRKITCTSHGKTYADIGSIWNNGTHDYTIVAIVDENNLLVLGENLLSYPLFSFAQDVGVGDTLTHVSGATHTSNISVSASATVQFCSSLRVQDLKLIADGKEIIASGEYKFKHLDICEMYDVLNVASVLSLIQQGVGTFTENPNPNSFLSADKVARHSIIYGFDSAGEWRIRTDFIAYQDIVLDYFGFTQQGILGTGAKMYIPKALPFGGKDFRTIADYASLDNSVVLSTDYWENPNLPPDRWIQYDNNICIHSGYLFDYGVGGVKRKDFVNTAFYLYKNTRKTYPYGINSKISVSAGDVFSAVVWRSYMDLSEINTGGVIAVKMFEYDGKLYIYGDFNASGIYEFNIPEKYIGKMISVFEKSDNVTLLAGVANAKVLVKVVTASPMYGYIVAQINP